MQTTFQEEIQAKAVKYSSAKVLKHSVKIFIYAFARRTQHMPQLGSEAATA